MNQEELIGIRKKHFLPTAFLYHQEPIELTKAQGEYVWDRSGKRYLDAIGGIVCIASGHNHPKIKALIKEMLDQDEIQHTSLLYLSHPVTELAEKVVQHTPKGVDRVTFTNSGSEANEMALLASRQSTGENIVVNLRHGYHGGTAGTIAQCGQHSWRFRAQPHGGTVSAQAPYCYRCPFGKKPDSCALECAKDLERTIQTSTHGKIAAFIAEPILGVGGFITPPPEYFKEVCEITHRYGGRYISDEVQTGSGRCGEDFFYTKTLGIPADIITTAKSFGNGAPIGAVAMTSEVADSLSGKLHFNTFGGDPYQAAQAKANMEIIEDEGLIQNAREMGEYLQDQLLQLKNRFRLIGDVRGRGLLMGIELVKDQETKEYAPAETARLMDLCKDKGVLVGKGGLFGNVIRIAPPLSIKREQVDVLVRALDESLFELQKKG